MRKIVLFFAILCAIALSGCGSQQPTPEATTTEPAESNPFAQSDIPEEWITTYWDSFADYYSPNQYLDLCNIMRGLSAKPKWAINSNLFTAVVDKSTYNSVWVQGLLINSSGDIVKEYAVSTESRTSVAIPSSYKIGDYFMLTNGKQDKLDVYNASGEFIGTFDVYDAYYKPNLIFDIGDNYYIFPLANNGSFWLQLINPDGEIFHVKTGRDTPPYQYLEDGAVKIGNLSEGMFSIRIDYLDDIYAYYFDVTGEVAIDLSAKITNFKVTEMGEFKNEQATIYFTGIDNHKYSGIIDKTGAFIEEPKPLS